MFRSDESTSIPAVVMRRASHGCARAGVLSAGIWAASLTWVCPVWGEWIPNHQVYSIHRLGLFGPEYTSSTGLRINLIEDFDENPLIRNDAGMVTGWAVRFLGTNSYQGQDAWVWNGSQTHQIGLVGPDHTSSSGYRFSISTAMNQSGQVVGRSSRGINGGSDAWFWDGSTTTRIGPVDPEYTSAVPRQVNDAGHVVGSAVQNSGGLDHWVWDGASSAILGFTGAEHTGSAGYRYSTLVSKINSAGKVVGTSDRFTGVLTHNGRDAWLWDGSQNLQVGFTGPGYEGTDGFRVSGLTTELTQSGWIGGYSSRVSGVSTTHGADTWITNGVTTIPVGLSGPEHIGSGGYRDGEVRQVNEVGDSAGISIRVLGLDAYNGSSAWVRNGLGTHQVGLTSPEHTGSAGYQGNWPRFLNQAGLVAGGSERITGVNSNNGYDAWVWDGNATIQVGLTGPEYTSSTGYRWCFAEHLSPSGRVFGISSRYGAGDVLNGSDVWTSEAGITTNIGLTDDTHTGSEGYRQSTSRSYNESGQTIGLSSRILGANTYNGLSGWVYDPASNLTHAIIGSVRTFDNFAYTNPITLTEDGFVLGTYLYFDGGIGDGVFSAFVFRPDLGFTDLGALVEGGLSSTGWARLENTSFSDELRTIIGTGYVLGDPTNRDIFAMTIPAPGALGLLPLAGALRRRQSAARSHR